MIMTPVYAAYSVAVLGLVGGAPAQGGPGGGGTPRVADSSAAGACAASFITAHLLLSRTASATPPEPCMSKC